MPATAPVASDRDRETLKSFARRIDPSDAGAHNNLGVLYYNKSLYEDAVSAFTRALELDPKMDVARRNLEVAYFNTGYYDERVAQLRERLRVRADDREARWELGRAFSLLGQSEEAIAEFVALLEHRPGDVGAIIQLGLAEKATGNLGHALAWFEQARDLDPAGSVTHFYLGEVLYNQGRHEEALQALRRAIELNPENPDAHFLLGFVFGDMGRHEEARAASKRAVQLNPTLSRAQANLSIDQYNPQKYEELTASRSAHRANAVMRVAEGGQLAHYNLGLAFRQKGYYAEAQREYRRALQRAEDPALVRQAMAEVHLLCKEPSEALVLYDMLVAERSDSPKLWNERGAALHQEGRYADAAASYRAALAADPRYALAHNNLAVALYHAGEHEHAAAAFRAALEVNPALDKVRLNLALLLYKGGCSQPSLEEYRQVLKSDAEQPIAWNGIGLVLAQLRRFADARNAFARAVQRRPDFAEAHYNLSFTLSSLGDFEGALRETKRALELEPYYVSQRFALTIDLEYEDPDLLVQPDLVGEQRMNVGVEAFAFDPKTLDTIFTELSPAPEPESSPALDAKAGVDTYAIAADYFTKGLFDRATAETSRALARGGDQAEGSTLLGDILGRQGAYGDALERYRSAVAANPEHLRARQGVAQSLLKLGRATEAREVSEALAASRPQDVGALTLVATCRFEAGDPAGALEAFDRARRVAPQNADVLRRIGNISRALGDIAGAIETFQHALELDGDFAAARYDLACLLMHRQRWPEAEAQLVRALDTVPTYAAATMALASLRRLTGRQQNAVVLLVDLLQREPYSFDALITLGETLLELGRKKDAATAFRRVLAFDPDHPGALLFDGIMLADQRRYREAIAQWARVVSLDPAGLYAERARRESRTAVDLLKVFGDRARRA